MSDYSSNPLTYVPVSFKKPVYFIYALVGLVLGAMQLVTEVAWVADSLAVYGFVGLAIGATAASNVTAAKRRE